MHEIIYKADAVSMGLKRYFTGRPCKYGHIRQRSLSGNCMECQRLFRAKHRWSTEERRAYYLKNKERENENSTKYYKKHREKRISDASEYRKLNREKLRTKNKAWRQSNPQYASAHRHKNKDKYIVYRENRRSRAATGRLSENIVDALLVLQGGKCALCARPLNGKYHIDHIKPLCRGGTNTDSNVQLAHPTCNYKKGRRDPHEFMREMGKLL